MCGSTHQCDVARRKSVFAYVYMCADGSRATTPVSSENPAFLSSSVALRVYPRCISRHVAALSRGSSQIAILSAAHTSRDGVACEMGRKRRSRRRFVA